MKQLGMEKSLGRSKCWSVLGNELRQLQSIQYLSEILSSWKSSTININSHKTGDIKVFDEEISAPIKLSASSDKSFDRRVGMSAKHSYVGASQNELPEAAAGRTKTDFLLSRKNILARLRFPAWQSKLYIIQANGRVSNIEDIFGPRGRWSWTSRLCRLDAFILSTLTGEEVRDCTLLLCSPTWMELWVYPAASQLRAWPTCDDIARYLAVCLFSAEALLLFLKFGSITIQLRPQLHIPRKIDNFTN